MDEKLSNGGPAGRQTADQIGEMFAKLNAIAKEGRSGEFINAAIVEMSDLVLMVAAHVDALRHVTVGDEADELTVEVGRRTTLRLAGAEDDD